LCWQVPQLGSPTECLADVSPGIPPAEFVMRMLFPSSRVCDVVIPSMAVSVSPQQGCGSLFPV
jgi:hypothetical protein